jgi:hypothetical protein
MASRENGEATRVSSWVSAASLAMTAVLREGGARFNHGLKRGLRKMSPGEGPGLEARATVKGGGD